VRTTLDYLNQVKIGGGNCGGWTPTGKQITPTANVGQKYGWVGF